MNERDGHIVTLGVRVRDSEIKLEKVVAILNLDFFFFFYFIVEAILPYTVRVRTQ